MKVDGNYFRRQRLLRFLSLLPSDVQRPVRILDIGGTTSYWDATRDIWGDRSIHFTIINLDTDPSDDGVYANRAGDACNLPEFADNSFDIVHSNSVIEHVGHWGEMSAMAREVRRLAPAYYVQTPDFAFPIEPHYRTPFFHWLPEATRAGLLMRHRLGFRGPEATLDAAMRNIQSVNLLTKAQLCTLFPDSEVAHERVLGLSKSITAIRRGVANA